MTFFRGEKGIEMLQEMKWEWNGDDGFSDDPNTLAKILLENLTTETTPLNLLEDNIFEFQIHLFQNIIEA